MFGFMIDRSFFDPCYIFFKFWNNDIEEVLTHFILYMYIYIAYSIDKMGQNFLDIQYVYKCKK